MNIHSVPDLFMTRYPLLPVPSKYEKVDCPARVTMLIPECVIPVCREGDTVYGGQALAERRLPGTFASCSGKIVSVAPRQRSEDVICTAVTIEKHVSDKEPYRLFDPIEYVSGTSAEKLYEKLQMAGCTLPRDNNPFLIRCIDSDCEAVTNRWYMENHFDRILQGIEVLRKLSPDSRLFIAVSAALSVDKKKQLSDKATLIEVEPYYPAVTTDRIIASDSVLKKADRIGMMDCSRLGELVSTLETGNSALTQKVLVKSGRKQTARFFEVPIGMSAGDLLTHAEVKIEPGSQVIFGGTMTGHAVNDLTQPITTDDTVVMYVPPGDVVLSENVSCVNCGRCVRACPVGLRVDLIAKCIEFSHFDEANRLGIMQCIDCGCCTAVCIVHRPLAYHCYFGKKERASRSGADG